MNKITVIKRDGRQASFDMTKIDTAVDAAWTSVHGKIDDTKNHNFAIGDIMKGILNSTKDTNEITVEEIQDIVEKSLMKYDPDVAKCYILYRAERTKVRTKKSKMMQVMRDLTFSDAKDSDIKRENGNINGNSAMGLMLKYGSENSKEFALTEIIDERFAELHRKTLLYQHDLDFYATGTLTCLQIPLKKIFSRGFSTGHGNLRPPKSIRAYSSLACIVIQASQNDFH